MVNKNALTLKLFSLILFILTIQVLGLDLKNAQSLPGEFQLSTDAGNPETDGEWHISWTESEGANYYNIYTSSQEFNDINDADKLPSDYSQPTSVKFTADVNSNHFFRVVAVNDNGMTLSNLLHVEVIIDGTGSQASNNEDTTNGNEDDTPEFSLSPYVNMIIVIGGIIAFISLGIIMKMRGSSDDNEPTLD